MHNEEIIFDIMMNMRFECTENAFIVSIFHFNS